MHDEFKDHMEEPQDITWIAETSLLVVLATVYFTVLAYILGRSDIWFLVFWIFTFLTIIYQATKIRHGLRNMLKDPFSTTSPVHKFFSRKSFIQSVVSVIVTIGVSLSFLITLKLLALKYGFVATIFILSMPVVIIFMAKEARLTFSLESHLRDEDSKKFMGFAIDLFTKATMMAAFVALVFSCIDAIEFYKIKDINFFNFADEAAKKAISLGDGGHKVRTLVNFMVIIDTFTFAAVNQLMDALSIDKDSIGSTLFLFIIFFVNLVKLMPFCIAYVFVVFSLGGKPLKVTVLLFRLVVNKVLPSSKVVYGSIRDKLVAMLKEQQKRAANKKDAMEEKK